MNERTEAGCGPKTSVTERGHKIFPRNNNTLWHFPDWDLPPKSHSTLSYRQLPLYFHSGIDTSQKPLLIGRKWLHLVNKSLILNEFQLKFNVQISHLTKSTSINRSNWQLMTYRFRLLVLISKQKETQPSRSRLFCWKWCAGSRLKPLLTAHRCCVKPCLARFFKNQL